MFFIIFHISASENITYKYEIFNNKIENFNNIPIKFAIYSSLIPGLGQWYNNKKIKSLIILGTSITNIGFSYYYHNNYEIIKKKYINFLIKKSYKEFNKFDLNIIINFLSSLKEEIKKNKIYCISISVAFYIINIIDAFIDSYLSNFDFNNQLNFDIKSEKNKI